MKLTISTLSMAVAILTLTSTTITTIVTAVPSSDDNFGPGSSTTASKTTPPMGLNRRQLFHHRRGFDPYEFVNSHEAALAKEAAAAPPSDSAPVPQTIAAEPAPIPAPAQTA
ncbi:hypothetical protein F5H01DRAFT_408105 [Linnemannia elongata]|nr:hypothetical protein F5H01DRAFT_408105 [Linnemannia elongata]